MEMSNKVKIKLHNTNRNTKCTILIVECKVTT